MAGQSPDRDREPCRGNGDAEHPQARREDAPRQRNEQEHDRHLHRPPLADAGGELTSGQVAKDMPESDEPRDEACHRDGGTEVQGAEDDDRRDGALPDAEQQLGEIDARDHGPYGELRLGSARGETRTCGQATTQVSDPASSAASGSSSSSGAVAAALFSWSAMSSS